MVEIIFRTFRGSDYPAAIALAAAVYPDYAFSEEEWRQWDSRFDGVARKLGRIVAEGLDGRMVGLAQYSHSWDAFQPQKFLTEIIVHPNHQGRGIGARLYDALMESLQPWDPVELWARVGEVAARGIRFAEARGFREARRIWESRLDVTKFDPTPFLENAAHALERFEISTVAELQHRDADWLRKVYELRLETAVDVPREDAFTPPSLDEYSRRHSGNPDYLADAHFIMKDRERYIAESNVFRSQGLPSVLYQEHTGTQRAYRNQGLALGLKLRTIQYAREHGYTEIRTWNDSLNAPMLHINAKLGFVKQPTWILFKKQLKARNSGDLRIVPDSLRLSPSLERGKDKTRKSQIDFSNDTQ